MSQGLLSSDLAVIRDVASFSPAAARLQKAITEFETLQRQRRALGAPRPNLEAALALRDSDPTVARLWQQTEECWTPLSVLGFPQLARRISNETMAEALVVATHAWRETPEEEPMALSA